MPPTSRALCALLSLAAIGVALLRLVAPAQGTSVAAAQGFAQGAGAAAPAASPRVILARAFELDRGAPHRWKKGSSEFQRGLLLVLEADPRLIGTRQEAEPVLMCGEEVLLRVNQGARDGRLVAILPLDSGVAGAAVLAAQPLWFSAPGLPEALEPLERIERAQQARMNGIEGRPAAELAAAFAQGGPAARLVDETELWRAAARLVLRFAPSERELAQSFLLDAPR